MVRPGGWVVTRLTMLVWLLAAGALLSCSRLMEPVVLGGATMGTDWTVRLASVPSGVSVVQLRVEIEALLEQVNAEMSTFREDSEITRYNRAAAGERVRISEGFANVVDYALTLASETGGAYDPTVGPLVNLWGFGPEPDRDEVPSAEALAEAMRRVGWRRVELDPKTRSLLQPGGVYLDLSSVAKGYGVDLVAEHLIARGVSGFLVDIGGDLRTHGTRPDRSPWRVAIEQPTPGRRAIQEIIEIQNLAVATSGSYRNFFEAGGRRYSHTIDPRNGFPVSHHTVSVTVLADRCVTADALATALGVLPPDEAERFALERNLAVLWLVQEDGALIERITPAFRTLRDARAR